jgi:hypothetical protein
MLGMLDSGVDSMKRAYGSLMDLAAIPFIYGAWYDQRLFEEPTIFGYAYLAGCILSFAAKEIIERYKEANPELEPEDYLLIIRAMDASFKAINSFSEIIFPAIILDVIYRIKNIFSEKSLSIIHPVFVGVAGFYGMHKGLEHFGLFKKKEALVDTVVPNYLTTQNETETHLHQTEIHAEVYDWPFSSR